MLSEFDLADAWDDRPVLAITGTNGKTTVTTLVDAMLERLGRAQRRGGQHRGAAGRGDRGPVHRRCSSSRPRRSVSRSSRRFRPRVATWLNFAEDHLDVHDSLDAYRDAKARIWADQGPDDVAVANCEDPVVLAVAADAGRRAAPCSLRARRRVPTPWSRTTARSTVCWSDPTGSSCCAADELWSSLPHDRSNALAAAATALAGGAALSGRAHRAARLLRVVPPGAAGRESRRRPLVRRLQGHCAPRHARGGARVRLRRADRRRSEQGARPGCARRGGRPGPRRGRDR